MENQLDILSFLDMLDLDEDLIDSRLKTITTRSNYTNKHLSNALQLIQYKLLINKRENDDCDNRLEYDYVVKLIKEISPETVDMVCKITSNVLKLNSNNMVSNSEHLLQQILSNLDLENVDSKDETEASIFTNMLLYLRICDSILDAVIQNGEKVSLLLLDVPLERLLKCTEEKVSIHFITSTVPRLFKGVNGYNILDKVWEFIIKLKGEHIEISLKVLSSLSDYYLPTATKENNMKFESGIVKKHEFWDIVLFGLMSTDFTLRKISVYLAKRAIDYISDTRCSIQLKNLFNWSNNVSEMLKLQWNNYFILIDSLEEKQSNIVLPSLQLFDTINNMENCWLNCAFNLGLKHDNAQVRLKCVEYRLKTKMNTVEEATILLQALDDFNFYDNNSDRDKLKAKIANILKDHESLVIIIKAIPLANITPVPLYHISDVLANLDDLDNRNKDIDESEAVIDLFKAPCNIIAMRKAVHVNLLQFVGKFYKHHNWKFYANIISLLHINIRSIDNCKNAFIDLIKNELLINDDIKEFYNHVFNMHHIDFGLLYLESHPNDISILFELIDNKIKNINNIVNRQYSDKTECYNDVIFLLKLQNKCIEIKSKETDIIRTVIDKEFKTILLYISNLLVSDANLSVDDTRLLFDNLKENNNEELRELLIDIYKNSVTLLKATETDLNKDVLAMCIVNNLSNHMSFVNQYKHEMLDLKDLLYIVKVFESKTKDSAKSIGRVRNIFYEKHCETVYLAINDTKIDSFVKNVVDYIENITETGGYGCLNWILKIMNVILKTILDSDLKFNVNQFINRMWREIEELKTNHQYPICMKEFVVFITQDALIEKPEYNNVVILYCTNLIEYGFMKNTPLFYLVGELKRIIFSKHSHMVFVLSKLLLYCPVPKKDQRIADNLAINILKDPKFGTSCYGIDLHFNFEIQYAAISILSTIKDDETLDTISKLIMAEIDLIFKSKLRYHGNSQVHRTLQTALQHLLLILLLKKGKDSVAIMSWCSELLGRLPHQTSVRVCFEWYIAVSFHLEKHPINNKLLRKLKAAKFSLPSQFVIIFWLLKHKISDNTFAIEEYEFVLDTLLSHTMGQMFNVRLQSQYLAKELYKLNNANTKYEYTIKIINKTLEENSTDKNFVKLKDDYFANKFDVISNLSPYFIYHVLPRLCDVGTNEVIDIDFLKNITNDIAKNITENNDGLLWLNSTANIEELFHINIDKNAENKVDEDVEASGTIQKKYIPWNSMNDVQVYDVQKKRDTPSELIVVASLIDKLPNLGGMARTSEVFGVKTYVINSLRHLQDRQFQGLSVSAERWIDVEEIRPGSALKEYLNRMKSEGYAVVAAEQTSTSSMLQKFKFPKKTLLLLGHEKDGVPCDLLPMMDHCIEIPQQGFVRSLNVHVTAAIFVWEYARQHLL